MTNQPLEPPMRPLPGTGPDGFLMGDPQGRDDEQPVHHVRLRPFAIMVTPVTNRQYALFLESTAHAPPRGRGVAPFDDAEAPVCGVSWFDAVAYADWLTERTGRRMHLPTEAQREFAARGGCEQQAYPWGNEPLPLEGPYQRGLRGPMVGRPLPVATEWAQDAGANGFGLYHMADNVHEWCADYYDPNYYRASPIDDPPGPAKSDRRAARGGSWRHDIKFCRCAARSSLAPDKQFADFGFRVAESEGFAYIE